MRLWVVRLGGVLPAEGDIADTARPAASGVFGSSHLLKRSQEASTSLFDTRGEAEREREGRFESQMDVFSLTRQPDDMKKIVLIENEWTQGCVSQLQHFSC